MSDNVFAPPKANLEREASEEAPALWNPNAAAPSPRIASAPSKVRKATTTSTPRPLADAA